MLERDVWLVLNVDDRKLGVLLSSAESGMLYVRVAGYHAGETKFIGEKQNVLSVKVEPIPKSRHNELLPKIIEVLPVDNQ
jgi:hypothetical protein